ncbi:MAG TPA: ClbS/DfsB family four-helix bundle protein [Anaerolineales bacterium]|nr:ClbS/DfsB family four-helix bundle protein [Anaerolineales bacterium]
MPDKKQRLNKTELLGQIHSEWDLFQEFLAGFTPAQLAQAASGEWSIKDNLAHLTAWENRILTWTGMILHGEMPAGPKDEDEIQRWNAEAHEQDKNKSLATVVEEARQAHYALLKMVESLSEGQLQKEYTAHWPRAALWRGIAVDGAWHFREHREDLAKRLNQGS